VIDGPVTVRLIIISAPGHVTIKADDAGFEVLEEAIARVRAGRPTAIETRGGAQDGETIHVLDIDS
jgi:hypothetical protein